MLNFEEELKKFHPSMEIEEVEDAVRDHELTDMTDIMVEMLRRQKDAAATQTPPVMQQAQVVAQAVTVPQNQ